MIMNLEFKWRKELGIFSLTISEEYLALQQNDLELWCRAEPTL